MFIRAVHNRVRENVRSFDLSVSDGLVLVPLVLVILAFAVYPQQALDDSEASVERVVAAPAEAVGVAQRGATP
jgi:NADH-quinone oxidoreductase subunit M